MLKYRNLFVIVILIFSIVSLTSIFRHIIINYNNLFELLSFSIIFFVGFSKNRKDIYIAIYISMYVILSFFIAIIINDKNIFDFLLIYKSFIYLILLLLIRKINFLDRKSAEDFVKLIIVLFLIKYLIFKYIFYEQRPFLFYENNFELMFLAIIFFSTFANNIQKYYFYLILLIVVFFLSGSRSGLGMFFIIIAFSRFNSNISKSNFIKGLLLLFLLPFGAMIFLWRMKYQGLDITTIDRIVFLKSFLFEIKNWNFFNYLLGTKPITPLSTVTCEKLSFYQNLFSASGDGSCYSVVLHSFLLRAIYDHGFIGLITIILLIKYVLTNSNVEKREQIFIITIILANGLSVSSFNSVYCLLGLIFVIIRKREKSQKIKFEKYIISK